MPGLSLGARRLAPTSAAGRGEEKQYLDMGNSMESMSGPGVPERGTGPTHARHTAGEPTTRIANPSMPDQPPGKTLVPPDHPSGQTDLKLADAVYTNVKNTTVVGQAARDVEAPEQRSEKPDSTESPVREGKQPSLVPDSGYGPSLWTGELDTPKQRLSFSEMPDRPCGRRGGAEVCYIIQKLYNIAQSLVATSHRFCCLHWISSYQRSGSAGCTGTFFNFVQNLKTIIVSN